MAPEVHANGQPTLASDVFSLHVVMWEVSLCGQPNITGGDALLVKRLVSLAKVESTLHFLALIFKVTLGSTVFAAIFSDIDASTGWHRFSHRKASPGLA